MLLLAAASGGRRPAARLSAGHGLSHGIVCVSQRVTGPNACPPTRALAVVHQTWSPGASFTIA
jgi:hypothetical protein